MWINKKEKERVYKMLNIIKKTKKKEITGCKNSTNLKCKDLKCNKSHATSNNHPTGANCRDMKTFYMVTKIHCSNTFHMVHCDRTFHNLSHGLQPCRIINIRVERSDEPE